MQQQQQQPSLHSAKGPLGLVVRSTGRVDRSTHSTGSRQNCSASKAAHLPHRTQLPLKPASSYQQCTAITDKASSQCRHHRATHLIACEHVDKVWEGQHEVVVDSPAKAPASISSQQGRQEVCKGPGASLLIGHTELVQGLHQRCHHLNTHCIAVIAQQVQKCPAEQQKNPQHVLHHCHHPAGAGMSCRAKKHPQHALHHCHRPAGSAMPCRAKKHVRAHTGAAHQE